MNSILRLFSFLGWSLDKTRLTLSSTSHRWGPIRGQLLAGVGALGLSFSIVLIAGVGLVATWYGGTHPTPAKFFMVAHPIPGDLSKPAPGSVVTSKGLIVSPLKAGFSPQMSNIRMQSWLTMSLMQMFTFNMTNAHDVLGHSRWLFRPDTYRLFMNDMDKKGGFLESVNQNGLEVTLTPASTVRVIRQGAIGKRRVWETEIRVVLFFSGATAEGNSVRHALFDVTVEEVPPSENPYGLVIAKITRGPDPGAH